MRPHMTLAAIAFAVLAMGQTVTMRQDYGPNIEWADLSTAAQESVAANGTPSTDTLYVHQRNRGWFAAADTLATSRDRFDLTNGVNEEVGDRVWYLFDEGDSMMTSVELPNTAGLRRTVKLSLGLAAKTHTSAYDLEVRVGGKAKGTAGDPTYTLIDSTFSFASNDRAVVDYDFVFSDVLAGTDDIVWAKVKRGIGDTATDTLYALMDWEMEVYRDTGSVTTAVPFVSSINDSTGAATLAAGSNITITPSATNTFTIASTGSGDTRGRNVYAYADTLVWWVDPGIDGPFWGAAQGYQNWGRTTYDVTGGQTRWELLQAYIPDGVGSRDTLELTIAINTSAAGDMDMTMGIIGRQLGESMQTTVTSDWVADSVSLGQWTLAQYALAETTYVIGFDNIHADDKHVTMMLQFNGDRASWTGGDLYLWGCRFRIY